MITARKFSLKGGTLKTNERMPYKQDVFSRFIQWSTLTTKQRNIEELPTAKSFAKKYGISEQAIYKWKKRSDFLELKRQAQILSLAESTPDVLDGLKKRCVTYGTAYDVELFLLYVEGWERKRALEIIGEISFGENDIRSLVGLLPEDRQKVFYDTLIEIIAEAEHTRVNNIG